MTDATFHNALTSDARDNYSSDSLREMDDSSRQRRVHELAIEGLAKELAMDVEHVRNLYETEHARLAQTAKIKTYLPLITMRTVRASLQHSYIGRLQ